MKSLIVLISALFSLSVFANVDLLVGTYKGAGAIAKVTKTLVAPATLFDPAQYEYSVLIESSKFQLEIESVLQVEAGGKSLYLATEQECDDPGCTYYTDITVSVIKTSGKPVMEFYVHGYTYGEDGQEDKEVEGTIKLAKIK